MSKRILDASLQSRHVSLTHHLTTFELWDEKFLSVYAFPSLKETRYPVRLNEFSTWSDAG